MMGEGNFSFVRVLLSSVIGFSMIDVAAADGLISVDELDQIYLDAISEVTTSSGIDRSWEMRKCMDGWSIVDVDRAEVIASIGRGKSILVEVGGSGFASYEFVVVNGDTLRGSFSHGAGVHLEGELKSEVGKAYTGGHDFFGSSVSSGVDDGSCYFVTFIDDDGAIRKTAVSYGDPTGAGADLVMGVLAAANGR